MTSLLTKFHRRPWPTSIGQLRNLRISYAQFGEDIILTHLFGYEKTDGFYIDVGCFHPVQYSNTFIFYQRGWSGLGIDANPTLAPLWNKLRPRDKFINSGVAATAGNMEYLEFNQYPACNQLRIPGDQSLVEVHQYPDKITQIQTRPLSQILQSEIPPQKSVDFMSIDCEGLDEVVLQSHDFTKYRPKALVIEDHSRDSNSSVHQFCERHGYRLHSLCVISKIFVDIVEWPRLCHEK